MDIVVFGTGESSKIVLNALKRDKLSIVAFADNNFNKHGSYYESAPIINPGILNEIRFDYIIIAIIKFNPVKRQLVELGISEEKIIPYFNIGVLDDMEIGEIFYTDRFIRDNYELKLRQLTIKMENMPYEIYNSKKIYEPNVKGILETIQILKNTNVSISRFGDGEVKLMAGKDIGFQKAGKKLEKRLKEVMKSSIENHIVGILNVFGDLSDYTDEIGNYFRTYLYEYNREFQYSLLDKQKVYYDAFITRPYISYKDKSHARSVFDDLKEIWKSKNIVIVEGDRTRLGRGNDLFDNVKSCQRIICPNEDAFERYDEILEKVKKCPKDQLILLALGPTATVLSFDLAKLGYRAVDIGHIDIEYEWYLMGAQEKVVIKNKYTNEAYGGNSKVSVVDEEYEEQIIARVC